MNRIFQITLLLFFSMIAKAQVFRTDTAKAIVYGNVPMMSNYAGRSDSLQGQIDLNAGTISFQIFLRSLDTGNKKRNTHMYRTLDTDEHPIARLEGELRDYVNGKTGPQAVRVKGHFKIHGETRPVTIPGTLELSDEGLRFKASFAVNLTDHGMERPSMLFLIVKDEHLIEVSGTLIQHDGQLSGQ